MSLLAPEPSVPLRPRVVATAITACFLVAAAVPEAAADPQTPAQQKCSAANYKSLRLAQKALGKSFNGCFAVHAAGLLDFEECIGEPSVPIISAARAKIDKLLAAACEGTDKDGAPKVPEFGIVDPPTSEDVLVAAGFGEFLSLSAIFEESFDLDAVLVDFATDKTAAMCQIAVQKAGSACRAASLAAFASCTKAGLKGSPKQDIDPFADAEDLAACLGADPKGKIAAACDPLAGKIAKAFAKKCEGKGVVPEVAAPNCSVIGPSAAECTSKASQCGACFEAAFVANLDPAVCDVVCGF